MFLFHEFFKISSDGFLSCFRACMDSSCIAHLTPLVIVMRGATFHPRSQVFVLVGCICCILTPMAIVENISWQEVNLMNCDVQWRWEGGGVAIVGGT